jgi:hypothetical protein
MSIFDFLGKKPSPSAGVQKLKTHSTDDFADGVVIELKAIVNTAIATALESLEGRYLRSVLEQSHFTLDSLAIRSLDFETMRQLEDFLNRHDSIQSNFRENFFGQIIQPEYRSSRGAVVKTAPPLAPLVEISAATMESETDDESYRISLKGRRMRFEAHASLGGPIRTQLAAEEPIATSNPISQRVRSEKVSPIGRSEAPVNPTRAKSDGASITVRVRDGDGERSFLCTLPVQIGRASSTTTQTAATGVRRIELRSTYVSRQQLIIFELIGNVFVFVPSEASLSCAFQDATVLQQERIYRVSPNSTVILTAGVPIGGESADLDLHDRAQYPQIEIALSQALRMDEGTPRPRAVR